MDRPDDDATAPDAAAEPAEPAEGRGLRDDYPRRSGTAWALGAGALWGVLGYSVLWEGTPFEVSRSYVESALGTLLLLPVRLVLWAIRWVELLTDRTFDFSDNHLWIGVVACAVGALLVVTVFLGVQALWRPSERGR